MSRNTGRQEQARVSAGRRLFDVVRELISRLGPVFALVLLGAYLSIASPHFLKTSNLVNITRQSAITAILAVGQTLVILTSGIDLSVGAIAAISASAAAVLMTQRFAFLGMPSARLASSRASWSRWPSAPWPGRSTG